MSFLLRMWNAVLDFFIGADNTSVGLEPTEFESIRRKRRTRRTSGIPKEPVRRQISKKLTSQLVDACRGSGSFEEILDKLEVGYSRKAVKYLKGKMARAGLDFSTLTNRLAPREGEDPQSSIVTNLDFVGQLGREQLQYLVNSSSTYIDIFRLLKINPNGPLYRILKGRLDNLGIDHTQLARCQRSNIKQLEGRVARTPEKIPSTPKKVPRVSKLYKIPEGDIKAAIELASSVSDALRLLDCSTNSFYRGVLLERCKELGISVDQLEKETFKKGIRPSDLTAEKLNALLKDNTYREVAEEMGVSSGAVYYWARKDGIAPPAKFSKLESTECFDGETLSEDCSKASRDELIFFKKTVGVDAMSRLYKVSPVMIKNVLVKKGIE